MRIKYNAPTTLTYAFFCTLVVALDQFVFHGLTRAFFTVPNALAFDLLNPLNYLRLVTHIAGHADWNHLLSNLAYLLLLGPMLEETYGSMTMFLMMIVTGFVTGVLNACFFPHPLLGASGVVFMMILLASFTNSGKDDIPLTFILIVILYLGREALNAFKGDDISQFAHLAGGLCGSLFGFFKPAKSGSARRAAKAAAAGTSVRVDRAARATRTRSAATFASPSAQSSSPMNKIAGKTGVKATEGTRPRKPPTRTSSSGSTNSPPRTPSGKKTTRVKISLGEPLNREERR